ncbi:hypothetical protein [Argonema galeatum]|uniref:hypothetical protein n=1 Tax=Argonema galeatum TaxID=2942762 RepID=UPI002011D410|nr:hypothetical protein [Argonema galeatum]MCL1468032.1 hypothetical protein [Argonema galeatum A003/A1]
MTCPNRESQQVGACQGEWKSLTGVWNSIAIPACAIETFSKQPEPLNRLLRKKP